MTFSPDVYEVVREGAIRSARVIVPLVYGLLEPRTVVDVGCGEGWFAREFALCGAEKVVAYDESLDAALDVAGGVSFVRADIASPSFCAEQSDLAVCLEVAEHLPESSADGLISMLCAVAPIVLFSAAIPGQGGHGHLNEQWPAYWVERFERHGFEVSGELRWHLWGSVNVEPWYQQNLLVAAHRERARALLSDHAVNHGLHEVFGEHAFCDPIPVVHPTTFSHWVEIAKGRR